MVNVKSIVLSVIATSAAGASAADCFGKNPKASENDAWTARQAYCGNNLWKNTGVFILGNIQMGMTSPGANNQQTCWDAFENIIVQCRRNKFGAGLYDWNGVEYNMFFFVS